jgi:lathosterol oxidase
MSVLGVLTFHFPEYLTTPRLREVYDVTQVRLLLLLGLLASTLIGITALLFGGIKLYALLGMACTLLAWIGGGPNVTIDGPVRTASFYISLDWVLLDLLLIATLFISIERVSRLKEDQPILRSGWRVDLTHYVVNHLANGGLIYLITLPAYATRDALDLTDIAQQMSSLPLLVQVFIIMAITDLTQYWVHRASHRIPLLWRFHRIHHSVEVMDWLAGSRLHVIDILLTRSLSMIPMVLLGFSNEAINVYLPILALQSVFIHCNINYPLGDLRKILATPQFHHWHHTRDLSYRDRNFSVTFPFWDILFGSYHCPKDQWPKNYGLEEGPIGEFYVTHLVAPFHPLPDVRK